MAGKVIQVIRGKKSIRLNAILNAVRQSSALIFQLITFPYVSRVLGRSEYGRYSFSASVISYVLLLSGYGISNYAVREGARIRDDREKISDLASELFSINLITSAVAYAVLGILILGNAKIRDYALLVFIQSLSIILTTVGLDWINIIYEDYLYITIRYILLQFVALVLTILLIHTPEDTEKYCVILVLASYGGNLMNLVYIRKYIRLKPSFSYKLRQYMLPLTMLFVNSLATMVYVNSDITMLGFYQSDEIVGIYGFSSRIYNILKQFINSVIVVSVPRLAHLKVQDEDLYQAYIRKIFSYLILIIFPIAIGFAVFGDSVIYIVGGMEYLPGLVSFRILMLALIFALLASVFTNCILIINRCEKYCLVSTIVSATINVILNLFLIPYWGIIATAVTTVIAEMANLIIQSHFTKSTLRISMTISKKNLWTVVAGGCLVAIICEVVNYSMDVSTIYMNLIKILLGGFLSVLAYGLLLVITKNSLIYELVWKDKNHILGRK